MADDQAVSEALISTTRTSGGDTITDPPVQPGEAANEREEVADAAATRFPDYEGGSDGDSMADDQPGAGPSDRGVGDASGSGDDWWEEGEVDDASRWASTARPDSAAIAAIIEGFHDDYAELTPTVNSRPDTAANDAAVEDEAGEGLRDDAEGPDVSQLLAQARLEQAQLLDVNERLQRHIRSALDLRRRSQDGDDNKLGTAEARYMSLRKTLVEQNAKLQATEQHYDSEILELREVLQQRLSKSSSISQALRHFIVEVGKGSEHQKTGKLLSEKVVMKLDSLDREKESELQKLRLQNIDLQNRLNRLEQSMKAKEELAEGLHLIDFEQLKIENQSLNEKIEERNEELLKLKKKITTTVQTLTHMREKLQFVQRGNRVLAREVSLLETDLAEKRVRLAKVKGQRDKLRLQARKIRESSVYIGNPTLLDDMQSQMKIREHAQSDIEDLQEAHAAMLRQVAETTHKIIGLTQGMNLNKGTPVAGAVKKQASLRRLTPNSVTA